MYNATVATTADRTIIEAATFGIVEKIMDETGGDFMPLRRNEVVVVDHGD